MKKKIIIIFSILILIFILVYFFVFRIGKNIQPENSVISDPGFIKTSSTQANLSSTSDITSSTADIINNIETPVDVEAVNKKFIEYIPNVTDEQINTFAAIAAKGDMSGCEDLSSAEMDNCKYYFSVYKNQDGLCGDIEISSMKLDCYKKLIFNGLEEKVKACNSEAALDAKINCFNGIFWGNETASSCEMFADDSIRQICADSVNLRIILETNKNNCSEIKNTDLKTFCDQYFIPGDFDKDGLFDAEESTIGTNPYFADTDGDGYNDKEEIDKGYNPCGEGLMPLSEKLPEICAKYTK